MRNANKVMSTLNRDLLWQAQTPQTFKVELIRRAYVKLKGKVTDDAMAVEKLGLPVRLIAGSYDNIKVTTLEDLLLMAGILRKGRK
jgi:2-C-methyl-D-erythritol 4-phosphate cytidylyltransferase